MVAAPGLVRVLKHGQPVQRGLEVETPAPSGRCKFHVPGRTSLHFGAVGPVLVSYGWLCIAVCLCSNQYESTDRQFIMLAQQRIRLQPGVYAPVPTPFKDGTEEIDIAAFDSTVSRIGKAGAGILVGGTLGEGPMLACDERVALIRRAKASLRDAGLQDKIPVIAGAVGASVRECIAQAEDAASAGADAV